MRFSIAALALGAAGAMAGVVTETLTEYTTYCPEATSIVHGSKTYSISTVCLLDPSQSATPILTAIPAWLHHHDPRSLHRHSSHLDLHRD